MLEHRIDRRRERLADAIIARKNLYKTMLRPPGTRAPGEDQLTTEEAYRFWSQHRYDEIGMNVVAMMSPQMVAQIDAWLIQEEQKRAGVLA